MTDRQPTTGFPPAMPEADARGAIIVHHHLFKNAGTSFDAVLRKNFGEAWATKEFGPREEDAFRAWPVADAEKLAFSSHTAPIVPLDLGRTKVLQCVFIRHPIDRIKSAYVFESKQQADTEGARLAHSLSFAQYVQYRLDILEDHQCRNFHVRRLTPFVTPQKGCASPLERAVAALDRISFVGIVEEFDESMRRFHDLVRPFFPKFSLSEARVNVSRPHEASLPAKLRSIREELGVDLYERLIAANMDDLRFYSVARKRFVDVTLDFT